MNEIEKQTFDAAELNELKERCEMLERRTSKLQVALIVLSLMAFFTGFVQVHRDNRELDAIRPQLAQVMDYNKKQNAVLQAVAQKLVDYGRSHPDFTPIVMKYGLNTNAALLNPQSK